MMHQEAIQEMESLYSSDVFLIPNALVGQIGVVWEHVRLPFVVPLMNFLVYLCLAMSAMLFLDRIFMGIFKAFVFLLRRKPEKVYKWAAIEDDVELGNSAYPMVLVQIPMYNEREVPTN